MECPLKDTAVASYALAAISLVGNNFNQIINLLLGFWISDTHFPHFHICIPLYTFMLSICTTNGLFPLGDDNFASFEEDNFSPYNFFIIEWYLLFFKGTNKFPPNFPYSINTTTFQPYIFIPN